MKRLKYYLLQMDNSTTAYHSIYEGPVAFGDGCLDSDSVYWDGDVSYEFTMTHKQALDKPTVTVRIPASRLSADTPGTAGTAAADFLLRAFLPYADELNAELYNRRRTERENGAYLLPHPGNEVLVRNAAFFAVCPQKYYENGAANLIRPLPAGENRPPRLCFCLRMQVQLPLRRLRKAMQMLCRDLPGAVNRYIDQCDTGALREALRLAETQKKIREWLKTSDCCAFIANGSLLPRAKGKEGPMPGAVPFRSTPEDEREVCGVRGMAVRRGVTIIAGGGYSGKSTLLDAIAAGIHDHIAGDGRELVLTDESAVTIAAEDGRSVRNLDISPFVRWLPGGDVRDFSTDHASGSTSQAANVVEAVSHGASLLLIDEDRSATNFMIRDPLMKALVEKEPLTPFTDRVRELYEDLTVSTILVIGGSGEYLTPADRVYRMEDFVLRDVTAQAKLIARPADAPPPHALRRIHRMLLADRFSAYPEGSGSEKLTVSELGFICVGDERVDVRGLHDVVNERQLTALGFLLRHLMTYNADRRVDLAQRVDELYREIEENGLDTVYSSHFTTCGRFLDLPRKAELLALAARLRLVRFAEEP